MLQGDEGMAHRLQNEECKSAHCIIRKLFLCKSWQICFLASLQWAHKRPQ